MLDYVKGRKINYTTLPKEIKEYMIVKKTSWTLEYIRNLSQRDYEMYTLLTEIDERFGNKGDKV